MSFSPGSIFFCRDFQFDDGGRANKLLILLSVSRSGDYLFAKTTSRQNNRAATPGCFAADGYFLIPGITDFFKENTYIVFIPLYNFTSPEILTLTMVNKQLEYMNTLSAESFAELVKCMLACPDIKREYKHRLS